MLIIFLISLSTLMLSFILIFFTSTGLHYEKQHHYIHSDNPYSFRKNQIFQACIPTMNFSVITFMVATGASLLSFERQVVNYIFITSMTLSILSMVLIVTTKDIFSKININDPITELDLSNYNPWYEADGLFETNIGFILGFICSAFIMLLTLGKKLAIQTILLGNKLDIKLYQNRLVKRRCINIALRIEKDLTNAPEG